ncbi:MAG: TolB family protein, partial [Blastocatellia bacterium]
MKFITRNLLLIVCCGLLLTGLVSSQTNQPVYKYGLFEDSRDIGAVKNPGSVVYDDAKKTYTVAGGGENMWATTDAFHFVWRRVSGDFSIAADAGILGTGGNAHRKAVLIIRQNLEADSAYADAALHGDGLTSLQYREVKGGPTREIQSNVKAPRRLQIEKRGDYVWMSIARESEALQSAGGSFRINLTGT